MIEMTLQGRSWVLLMSPLYAESHVRGAVAVLRDMTEERRLDKLREDFIANVSHELRTPISMLQGYSEAIVDDIASTEEEKKKLRRSFMMNLFAWAGSSMICWIWPEWNPDIRACTMKR